MGRREMKARELGVLPEASGPLRGRACSTWAQLTRREPDIKAGQDLQPRPARPHDLQGCEDKKW